MIKHALQLPPLPPFVVLNIPHSSQIVPVGVRDQFLLSDPELAEELQQMTDMATLELYAHEVAASNVVCAEVSRLVVDTERFLGPGEPMQASGLGAIYERTSAGKDLRRALTEDERHQLLASHYFPHHERLRHAVEEAMKRHGFVLLLDGHSFSSKPLPYEKDQTSARPGVCIGSDSFHTPPELERAIVQAFETAGFDVKVNFPFEGALVPTPFFQTDKRVFAVMLEVNKSLYMDESTATKLKSFPSMQLLIRNAINCAVHEWMNSIGEGA